MDAVTYPEAKVVDFLSANFIPLQVMFDAQPLASQFKIKWTPSLIVVDVDGVQHHRTTGYLGPEEFTGSLIFGREKLAFDKDDFDQVLKDADTILKDYPKSQWAPRALYLRGVAMYKKTHQAAPLKEMHEKMKAQFPTSPWVERSFPYSKL